MDALNSSEKERKINEYNALEITKESQGKKKVTETENLPSFHNYIPYMENIV